MKATNYCFVFPLINPRAIKVNDEGVLVYNSMTNALAAMESDKFKVYDNFRKNGTPIKDEEFINQLIEGGFLIEDNYDELNELRYRLWGGRFNNNSLGLTLAPTSDCNFRCVYCYEKSVLRESYMNGEVIEAIKTFVAERLPHINSLNITWYGGEPLLAIDIVKELSQYFIEKCEENNVRYHAGIITNGYLLTKEIIETLNKYKVTFYQITIDGSKESHNARRFLANGEGTYDVIWDNLKKFADILPEVSIRVNVDRNNIQAANDIADMIKSLGIDKRIRSYLGRIMNDNDDPEMEVVCFTTSEFASTDLEYTTRNKNINYIRKYPFLRGNFCGADSQNSFVIDSDGKLYKCWNEVGRKDRSVGSILSLRKIGNLELLDKYMLFDPTNDPKCSKCKVLPICMGGCPYYRTNGKSQYQCSIYKQSLDSYISYVAENIMADREKEAQAITN